MFGNTGFGNQSGGLFGQKPSGTTTNTQSSLFGTPATNTASNLFGQSNQPSQPSSMFNTGTNLFGGGSSTTTFGQAQQQPSIFGTSTFGTTTVTGTTVKFDPIKGQDTMVRNNESKTITTKHMCITAMKQYENKCPEELRVEDYLANRKVPTAGTSGSFFGSSQPTSTTSTGPFGQTSGTTLFGGSKSVFGTASTTPSQTTTANQPSSLFSQKPASGFSFATGTTTFGTSTTQNTGTTAFGAAKPTTSLFGQPSQQQQPTSSLFGQPQQQQPPQTKSLFGQTSQQPAFGQSSTTTSAFGATAPAGGFSFAGAQPQASSGSLFGKPATSAPSGSATTTGFGSTGTGLFGQPTQKPGGLFGAVQPTLSTPFGSTSKPATTSLFGNTQTQQAAPSLFGTTQQTVTAPSAFMSGTQVAAPVVQAAPVQPIVLGSDVNEVALQQAIIDAQISSLPYGDSPLLKMSSTISGESLVSTDSPTNLQKQMRFLANKTVEKKTSSLARNGPSLLNSPLASARLDTSTRSVTNETYTYRPVLSMPSLGLTTVQKTTLNTTSSPSSKLFMSRTEDSTASKLPSTKKSHVKVLDVSVLRKQPIESPSLNDTSEKNHYEVLSPSSVQQTRNVRERPPIGTPPVLNLDQSSPGIAGLDDSRIQQTSPANQRTAETQTEIGKSVKLCNKPTIVLARNEYYVEPSIPALKEATVDGVCSIHDSLTIGRLGYGSVYWQGPFELKNLNLDEIVHFRHKEVIVYPDENHKPEVGQELNRPAEVSLERVWPTDKTTRQPLKDPEELAQIGFRERLERYCYQMDAKFVDYKPETGTWTFRVKHFSKYGYVEDSDDEAIGTTKEELELLRQQREKQMLIQRAKVPLKPWNELPSIQNDKERRSPGLKGQEKMELNENKDDAKLTKFEDAIDLFGKRIKLDEDLINVSKDKYATGTSCAIKSYQVEKPQKRLIARSITNRFDRAISLKQSILAMLEFPRSKADYLQRGSCRINWHKDLHFVSGSLSSLIRFHNVEVIPLLESYMKQFLVDDGRQDEYAQFVNSDLFRLDPPSTLLKLIDSYLIYCKRTKNNANTDDRIGRLCHSLLIPESQNSGIERRIRLGEWLREELRVPCEKILNAAKETSNPFFKIYIYLVHGQVKEAIDFSKSCRLFQLKLMLSLYNAHCSSKVRAQFAMQIDAYDRINPEKHMDLYLEKVLLILSGSCAYTHGRTKSVTSCVENLNWLQILGIMIWFWSTPRTTLQDCVALYDSFLENCYISPDQEYNQMFNL